MNEPTKKQEEALREFLHSAVVPLIEDVLVKKLGQAMSYAKEQFAPPSKPCEITDLLQQKFQSGNNVPVERVTITRSEYEAALRSKNNG